MEVDSEQPTSSGKQTEIDEGLYSRQLYVIGREAQHKLTSSKVLIAGLGG